MRRFTQITKKNTLVQGLSILNGFYEKQGRKPHVSFFFLVSAASLIIKYSRFVFSGSKPLQDKKRVNFIFHRYEKNVHLGNLNNIYTLRMRKHFNYHFVLFSW